MHFMHERMQTGEHMQDEINVIIYLLQKHYLEHVHIISYAASRAYTTSTCIGIDIHKL